MIQPAIPYDVTLSRGHLDICRQQAEYKGAESRAMNARGNQYNEQRFSQYDANYVGALGEYATSIFSGIPHRFGQPYRAGAADVGLIEVRTRSLGKTPVLRVYEKDPHPLTLLAGIQQLTDDGAIVRLYGWIYTQHGWSYGRPNGSHWKKGTEYWLDFGGSLWYPMDRLKSEHQLAERFYNS